MFDVEYLARLGDNPFAKKEAKYEFPVLGKPTRSAHQYRSRPTMQANFQRGLNGNQVGASGV